MKVFKVLCIYLLLSSVMAYSYSYYRTDGNISKSVKFAFYYKAFELGLIPIILRNFKPEDKKETEIVRVIKTPTYNPHTSLLVGSHHSRLRMDSFESPSSFHGYYSSYHSRETINKLRAGDIRWTEAAWLLLTIWMLQHQSAGLLPINPPRKPIENQFINSLLFGRPRPPKTFSREISIFDRTDPSQFRQTQINGVKTLEEAKMLPDLMTFEEAKTYAYEKAPEPLQINGQHHVSGLQAAKKTPHLWEMGLDTIDYQMTDENVALIRQMGLYNYLQKGFPMPPKDFIEDLQKAIKDTCLETATAVMEDKPYTYNGEVPISIYQNKEKSASGKSVSLAVFDDDSGDLITMGKRGNRYMKNVIKSGNMGNRGGTVVVNPPDTNTNLENKK
jgi:hypothetical protein